MALVVITVQDAADGGIDLVLTLEPLGTLGPVDAPGDTPCMTLSRAMVREAVRATAALAAKPHNGKVPK